MQTAINLVHVHVPHVQCLHNWMEPWLFDSVDGQAFLTDKVKNSLILLFIPFTLSSIRLALGKQRNDFDGWLLEEGVETVNFCSWLLKVKLGMMDCCSWEWTRSRLLFRWTLNIEVIPLFPSTFLHWILQSNIHPYLTFRSGSWRKYCPLTESFSSSRFMTSFACKVSAHSHDTFRCKWLISIHSKHHIMVAPFISRSTVVLLKLRMGQV